eukprot:scaffold2869_cov408-Pavlova_lutheri.AAC.1
MELRCNINCGGGNENTRTTFLNVPPHGLEHRGDTNARANERERTPMPPPAAPARHGKRRWAPKRYTVQRVIAREWRENGEEKRKRQGTCRHRRRPTSPRRSCGGGCR